MVKLSPPCLKKPVKEIANTPRQVIKAEDRKGLPHLNVTRKSIADKESKWV